MRTEPDFSSPVQRVRRERLWFAPLIVGLLVGCRSPRAVAGDGDAPRGLDQAVSPELVTPEFEEAWAEVVDAQKRDPAGEDVVKAADALLAATPPPALDVGASLAKAEAAYLRGDDPGAVSVLDGAAGRVELDALPGELALRLRKLRASALARGGDPQRALRELAGLDAEGEMATVALRAARAAALDRTGDQAKALAAYVAWRELLPADDPSTGYAEQRMRALARGLEPATLRQLARDAPGPDARACLDRWGGADPASYRDAPPWTEVCGDTPEAIGILLPRSGRLRALADEHLAAAMVAVEVLSRDRAVRVHWADSASSREGAERGAEQLAAMGVSRIVGPLAPGSVGAVDATHVPFVVPGEAAGGGEGVAPSLESRVGALFSAAKANGRTHIVVLAPRNPYGTRAVDAARVKSKSLGLSILNVLEYEGNETSFAKVLEPARSHLDGRTAVVVFDALPRAELIVRQLRRWQVEGPLILTTGEGYGHRTVGRGHEALDGVWIAPVAAVRPEDADFTRTFERNQGHPPSDQALLVWRAIERAWRGGHEASSADVRIIDGGRLVPIGSQDRSQARSQK